MKMGINGANTHFPHLVPESKGVGLDQRLEEIDGLLSINGGHRQALGEVHEDRLSALVYRRGRG